MSLYQIIPLVLLFILFIAVWPRWPYARDWGYYPSSIAGILLIVVFVVLVTGCVTNPLTGKRELDPAVRNAILQTAIVEANILAKDFLATGNINTRNLIVGGLSQVYTLSGTATPVVKSTVSNVVGNVVTNPELKSAVTNAAINTIEKAQTKGLDKTDAVTTGVDLLTIALQTQLTQP